MAIDVIAASCSLNNITLGSFHMHQIQCFSNLINDVNFEAENRHHGCNDANEFREKVALEFVYYNLFQSNSRHLMPLTPKALHVSKKFINNLFE